jgi:tetratricopeptide (TPR) repeat protein
VLAALAATRLLPEPRPPVGVDELEGRASRAYASGQWEDAAEYARHAVDRLEPGDPRKAELLCVRGEALLRAGHPREAARAFGALIEDVPGDPHRAQALFSGARAREASGDPEGAALWRQRLRQEFPDSPWTERLADEVPPP